jgi:hypothetical protein
MKVIQLDDFEILRNIEYVDRKMRATIFQYPIIDRQLPIQITWRYRLYKDDNHIFSYVAETKALIENDDKETTRKGINMIIQNLLIQFQMNWEEKTENTFMYGHTIPAWQGEQLDSFIQNITDWMKPLPL